MRVTEDALPDGTYRARLALVTESSKLGDEGELERESATLYFNIVEGPYVDTVFRILDTESPEGEFEQLIDRIFVLEALRDEDGIAFEIVSMEEF